MEAMQGVVEVVEEEVREPQLEVMGSKVARHWQGQLMVAGEAGQHERRGTMKQEGRPEHQSE